MEATHIMSLAIFLVLAFFFTTAVATQCYECNSAPQYHGSRCDDPFGKDEEFLVDCDALYSHLTGRNYTHCRKLVQNVEGSDRIVRQCASRYRDPLKCVERTGTKEIKLSYCECEGEGCNTATPTSGFHAINMILLTAVSGVLALLLHS